MRAVERGLDSHLDLRTWRHQSPAPCGEGYDSVVPESDAGHFVREVRLTTGLSPCRGPRRIHGRWRSSNWKMPRAWKVPQAWEVPQA